MITNKLRINDSNLLCLDLHNWSMIWVVCQSMLVKVRFSIIKGERFECHIRPIAQLWWSYYFYIRKIGRFRNLLSYNACSTIIQSLISCRFDYCKSLLYNVPTHKTDRLKILQNQCARILTKSPRREHLPRLKNLHWLKIEDRIIIYTILMLTYKSYYNIAPSYLCELISRR